MFFVVPDRDVKLFSLSKSERFGDFYINLQQNYVISQSNPINKKEVTFHLQR